MSRGKYEVPSEILKLFLDVIGLGRTTIKFVFGVRWRYAKKNNCKISRRPRVDFCKTFIFLRTIFLSFELK